LQFTDFGFDARLLKSVSHLGFDQPTEIQAQAIPVAMMGRDLIASSKTGSGKTLAYLLPAMQRLLRIKALSKRDARILILTPTRELAKQVYGQLRLLTTVTQTRGILLTGGENFNDQVKQINRHPDIIVATPGRLADHLLKRHLYIEGLELLIFDEADRMLDLGFAAQLKMINQAANHRRRQTLMFSATLDNAEINEIALELLREPERVAIGQGYVPNPDIVQKFYLSDHLEHKEAQLKQLLSDESITHAIIFTATRADTQRLAEQVAAWGHSSAALSGELNQSKRNQIMDGFSRGHQKVLVTTDLASRGLDISHVTHVINFDIPKYAEEYVHRVGRTGRAGREGQAVSLVGPKDWINFKNVEVFLNQRVEFDSLEGLEARFTGLKPAKKPIQAKPKQAQGRNATNQGKPIKKPKRDKTFVAGVEMGDAPMRRRVIPAEGLQDDPTQED
jgi:superfamily II DNA/RNA helicase